MAKVYEAFFAEKRSLYIPDISAILKRSDLRQKPVKGVIIIGNTLEEVDHSLDPCTTHPDFWVRVRAYIMTICFIAVETVGWFPYELAIEVVDFIFDAINFRPDGIRPSLPSLTSCYILCNVGRVR